MPSITRREIRDSAMKLLYETSMRDDPVSVLYEIAEEIDEIIVNNLLTVIYGQADAETSLAKLAQDLRDNINMNYGE